MVQVARCPSCGAPVEFKSAASILAVCDFCQSTLIRQGEALENLGKMAALIEDRSPLQRGAGGSWQGRRFTLVGRIQLKYDQGLWNEWYLLFDDGSNAWLSEAGGEFLISQQASVKGTLPPFNAVRAGQQVSLGSRSYTVSNVLVAECIAGEGELPFKVGAGYPAPVADLRDDSGHFATFDYSDADENGSNPLLFVGEAVDFGSLGWSNLRSETPLPKVNVQARSFNCPACGAPITVSHEDVATVGCGSCGAVIDSSDERLQILAKASLAKKVQPLLEPGSKGNLRGHVVEVLGFMRRRMRADNVDYFWTEYVLLAPDNKLLWLTEYDGHWNIARVLSEAVKVIAGTARRGKESFKHFAAYTAHVDYVIGEFPWRVLLDETAQVDDFVAPPLMLSKEQTATEVTWTLGEYVAPAEIQAAFKTAPPLPYARGVYANQPNPHATSHRTVFLSFLLFAVLALTIQFVLLGMAASKQVIDQTLTINAGDDEAQVTVEFVLASGMRNLTLSHDTSVNDNWVGLNTTLVNEDTGDTWQDSREMSYYSGVEDGDSWSEGSRGGDMTFSNLPPGHYVIAVESDMDAGSPPVRDHIRAVGQRTLPHWSTLALLLGVLVIFPIITRVRRGAFEIKRWAESDHPLIHASSGSDDDGGSDDSGDGD